MKRPHEKSCKCFRRRAFSLIEVVASLVLLGTLLVGILSAHRQHASQVRSAKARLGAIAAANRLLEQWRDEGVWGASASTGTFKDCTDLAWRWNVVAAPELRQLGAAIGRLEIVSTKSPDQRSLAAVEIMITDVTATASFNRNMTR